ncbi:MAG: retroviral-like aspartic protease family protein [Prevotellaceae bacterium]|jgi:aspartyl protease family protein|nr:retroviral-like aspartic protease family protein [Prevotellaceae bacterium]
MKKVGYIFSIILLSVFILSCKHKPRGKDVRQRESDRKVEVTRGKTIVKMKKHGGVYHIPCKINGNKMEFIFDTGASDITMSLTEALFLYKQNKLSDSDFLGVEQYRIANGSIEEGTVIRLRSVEIGNRKLTNVRASIVHNMEAPLLLGQSALAKFGKISIDYKKNEITFE